MKKELFCTVLLYSIANLAWEPDFLILGEQKCGTSSLYANMVLHPQIAKASEKELFFFTQFFHRGYNWYKSQFSKTRNALTGEASTDYLCDVRAPFRISKFCRNTKFIIVMRDPISRAFSHFHHERKLKNETKVDFHQAMLINARKIEIEGESVFSGMINFEDDYIDMYIGNDRIAGRNGDYLSRGIYIQSIERWLTFFPRKQFHFLFFEDFVKDPNVELNKIYNFLGVKNYQHKKIDVLNVGKHSDKMPLFLINELQTFYRPYNLKLEKFLNKSLPW